MVEQELEQDEPFSGKSAEEIQAICASIQEFCISEKPPKSWTGSNSKKKEHLRTLAPEKAPFPMHHYECLDIPPKRVAVCRIYKKIGITKESNSQLHLRNRKMQRKKKMPYAIGILSSMKLYLLKLITCAIWLY